jgi:2-polyprenyl-3-methyl-5-hydroxy-6-metoxy-1,4-benzoquinol methylase
LSQDRVIDTIAVVTNSTRDVIKEKVDAEQQSAGSAVNQDMKTFDVVPYQPSSQMDELYRSGHSFAIELAANYNDSARIKMAAFILVRLCTERTRVGRNLKILAVGDGIGSDSIRLASAGFDVDYMDYEASVTSKVATENFLKFKNSESTSAGVLRVLNRHEIEAGTYDAVISLEVIEHVEKPQDFLYFLQQQLMADGLLFLSDCFPGIKDYWQTHLLSNERLSGLVPLMAAPCGLAFQGFCQEPLYKPYVFQRSDTPVNQLISDVLNQASVIEMIVREQTKLVKARVRKIDKLIYIFKRLSINLRGYLARRRLVS